MSEPLHIVCPHCSTTNRVKPDSIPSKAHHDPAPHPVCFNPRQGRTVNTTDWAPSAVARFAGPGGLAAVRMCQHPASPVARHAYCGALHNSRFHATRATWRRGAGASGAGARQRGGHATAGRCAHASRTRKRCGCPLWPGRGRSVCRTVHPIQHTWARPRTARFHHQLRTGAMAAQHRYCCAKGPHAGQCSATGCLAARRTDSGPAPDARQRHGHGQPGGQWPFHRGAHRPAARGRTRGQRSAAGGCPRTRTGPA